MTETNKTPSRINMTIAQRPLASQARLAWKPQGAKRRGMGGNRIRLAHQDVLSWLRCGHEIMLLSGGCRKPFGRPDLMMTLAAKPQPFPEHIGAPQRIDSGNSQRSVEGNRQVSTFWRVVEREKITAMTHLYDRQQLDRLINEQVFPMHAIKPWFPWVGNEYAEAGIPVAKGKSKLSPIVRDSSGGTSEGVAGVINIRFAQKQILRNLTREAHGQGRRADHRAMNVNAGETRPYGRHTTKTFCGPEHDDSHYPVPAILRATHVTRNETLPAAAKPCFVSATGFPPTPTHDRQATLAHPSIAELLFDTSGQPASLDAFSFRHLPSGRSSTKPSALASPENKDGHWHSVHHENTATQTRLSRTDIDQLADRVIKIIKRQERMERESRGLF